jgi:hypothetical protein
MLVYQRVSNIFQPAMFVYPSGAAFWMFLPDSPQARHDLPIVAMEKQRKHLHRWPPGTKIHSVDGQKWD